MRAELIPYGSVDINKLFGDIGPSKDIGETYRENVKNIKYILCLLAIVALINDHQHGEQIPSDITKAFLAGAGVNLFAYYLLDVLATIKRYSQSDHSPRRSRFGTNPAKFHEWMSGRGSRRRGGHSRY